MMSRMVVLLMAAVIAVTATHAEELVAVARLFSFSPKNITGNLKIVQNIPDGPTTITGKIHGLTKGLHGFHIHETGDLSMGCSSAGPHFNPKNTTHGGPNDSVRHDGDLGNIEANDAGEAIINITDKIISVRGILGRSIVVHSNEDDLGKGDSPTSLTTGNSGDRVACGIIGIKSPAYGKWNSGSFTTPSVSTIVIFFLIAVYQHLKF